MELETFDRATWQVLTAILTLLGAVVTVLVWRSRGAGAGLRALAVTLLPIAAYLTGAVRMIWEIGDAVVSFAIRLTFSPVVWAGVSVLGVAFVLWVVGGFLQRRSRPVAPADTADAPSAVRRSERRRLGSRSADGSATSPATGSASAAGDGDDGDDDIEAILRRHGIS